MSLEACLFVSLFHLRLYPARFVGKILQNKNDFLASKPHVKEVLFFHRMVCSFQELWTSHTIPPFINIVTFLTALQPARWQPQMFSKCYWRCPWVTHGAMVKFGLYIDTCVVLRSCVYLMPTGPFCLAIEKWPMNRSIHTCFEKKH